MLRLKTLVTATALLATALPLSYFFYTEYANAKEMAAREIEIELSEQAISEADRLDRFTTSWQTSLRNLAGFPGLVEAANAEDKSMAKRILSATASANSNIKTTYFLDTSGQMIVRSDEEKLLNVADRNYFKISTVSGFGDQYVSSRSLKMPTINSSMAIPNPMWKPDSGEQKNLGYVGFIYSPKAISEEITKAKLGTSGVRVLFDSEGYLVGHSDKTQMSTDPEKLTPYVSYPLWKMRPGKPSTMKEGSLPTIATFTFNDVTYIGAVAKSYEGYYTSAAIPVSEAFEEVDKLGKILATYFGLAMVLALTLSWVVSNQIANRSLELAEASDAIANGNFDDEKLERLSRGSDEISQLAKSVLALSKSIRVAMQAMFKHSR